MDTSTKPLPSVNSWTKPFWQGVREEKLMIQKCTECGQPIFYPRMCCPFCFSDQIEWMEASGRGRIYTYTIVRSNAPSSFIADMPFVIAVVRLEEGVQMLSNIVDCEPTAVYCEMPVEVTFEKLSDEFTLPKFRPAQA